MRCNSDFVSAKERDSQMSDFEEVAEELLACARYGELLEIKQILSTVRSKNWKEEQIIQSC